MVYWPGARRAEHQVAVSADHERHDVAHLGLTAVANADRHRDVAADNHGGAIAQTIGVIVDDGVAAITHQPPQDVAAGHSAHEEGRWHRKAMRHMHAAMR